MRFSTHYYVLSLGTSTSLFFEAFRDSLIAVDNQGFPITGPGGRPEALEPEQRLELVRVVDETFGRYYTQEPLPLMVLGVPEMQQAFRSETRHGAAISGWIEGDHTTTSTRDLGQIVWPVVKEGMSGVLARALRDLDASAAGGHLALGLDAVVHALDQSKPAMLLVEDDYHQRGSLWPMSRAAIVTPDVDVREVVDDVVDAVIEKVLQFGGHVLFTPPGTLQGQNRIALLGWKET